MIKDLVSIIIPNYNHEKYLLQRIDSVLNQTYQNIEVILLDDCSTDNSLSIINQYKDNSKINHILLNEANSGSPFKQWKKGIDVSRGEYIWIAESDDFNDPKFIEIMVKHHKDFPTIGIAYSNSYIVDSSGEVIDKCRYQAIEFDSTHWERSFFSKGHDEVISYFFYASTIPNASSVLFKRKAIEKYINSIRDYKVSGDYMLYAYILHSYDIYYDVQFLNYFRTHGQTTRTLNQKNIECGMREVIKAREYIQSHFSISNEALDIIKERNTDRRDFFFDNTSNRLDILIKKLQNIPICKEYILSPYNNYTKLICDSLIESGYNIKCFLDKKHFDFEVCYNKVPVLEFKPNNVSNIQSSIFIIATDRYKQEIVEQINNICSKKTELVFY